MELELLSNKIKINNMFFKLELDEHLLRKFNKRSCDYRKLTSSFINTIFYHFLIKRIFLVEDILEKYKIKEVELKRVSYNNVILVGILKKKKIPIRLNWQYSFLKVLKVVLLVFNIVQLLLYNTAALIYILTRTKRKSNHPIRKRIAIINCNTSYKKVITFSEYSKTSFYYIIDDRKIDLRSTSPKMYISVYSIVSKSKVLKDIFFLIRRSFQEYNLLRKELDNDLLPESRIDILSYASKRIFYTLYIEYVLEDWFKLYGKGVKLIVSGVRDERFSKIQKNIANKFGIRTVCIPHGLAYNIDYPHGIFGDKYFATSLAEANRLKSIYFYTDQEFLFDRELVNYLFNVRSQTSKTKIVYFTESRNVKLDSEIISFLNENFCNVFVKLHPNDRQSNYSKHRKTQFIDDFSVAISNNIVISRNSTILLEAIYNNSRSISVLLNRNDVFNSNILLPSLTDVNIIRTYNFQELIKMITSFNINIMETIQ